LDFVFSAPLNPARYQIPNPDSFKGMAPGAWGEQIKFCYFASNIGFEILKFPTEC